MTALSKKTVVLVTHQVEFLTETDRILVMDGGQVRQQGKYAELLESGTAFEKLVSAHQSSIAALDTASQQNQVQLQQLSDDNIMLSMLQATRQDSDIEVSAKGPSTVRLTVSQKRRKGGLATLDGSHIKITWMSLRALFLSLRCVLPRCFSHPFRSCPHIGWHWLFRWTASVVLFWLGHIQGSPSAAAALPTLDAILRLFWDSRPPKHSLLV